MSRPGRPADEPDAAAAMLLATREELARADAKATTLFASTGVVFGAVLSGLLSGRWSPPRIDDGPAQVLWWLGAGAAVTALVLLACALFPRTRRDRRHGRITAYYEDVVRLGRAGLVRAVERGTISAHGNTVDQLYELSRLVHRKYGLIKVAMGGLGLACLFCAAALLRTGLG